MFTRELVNDGFGLAAVSGQSVLIQVTTKSNADYLATTRLLADTSTNYIKLRGVDK